MYVASADDLEELYNSDTPVPQRSKSVTPPRNAAPQTLSGPQQADNELALVKQDPVEHKILQAELSMANEELRTARAEQQRSEHLARWTFQLPPSSRHPTEPSLTQRERRSTGVPST